MNGRVALCLAAAARLQLAFDASSHQEHRKQLLNLAADCIDKTCPHPEKSMELALRRKANATGDQLALLVEAAQLLMPVREYGWPARRVRPNDWPAEHAPALRAVEQQLKQNSACPPAARVAVLTWLVPVWARYPQLQEPILQLFA
jgi:hypothetical protein